ncbi:DNA-binding transcriptional LysR family regulator [Pasteurella langaaensis DSM 22999]|uniref:DNA-binding transcriptional LysR family regulator n=1 Tax=Alitibacter langaaensis DSM 22999 TaxID=1122935 RepID=A0A2U0T5H6_9PAST|nr:LysR family transcriptional regulator [Pasteurella langaaensis]PVX38848.1 DNA-binding transcriptional LysR family regulator [Pasteurella langaaensis DSM 22999]
MDKISLDDMRLFVSVVQSGSLSRASELTDIPVSRLSRRLTQLEQALGTQLINRGKKGVTLNEVGTHFFERAKMMLQEAELAIESVQQSLIKPSGLLRISVASDIFHLLIEPHLGRYLQENPDVNVEINLSHQKINMIQDGIDLAVRVGTIDNDNVVAKSWISVGLGVFASPDYLAKYGEPQTPNDLYQHQIIGQNHTLPWHFQRENHQITIAPTSRMSSNDFLAVEKQIQRGMGIGALPIFPIYQRTGLVQILKSWEMASSPVSVIYYKNRGSVPTVRSMVEFLQSLAG